MKELETNLINGFEAMAVLYKYANSDELLAIIKDIQEAVKHGR